MSKLTTVLPYENVLHDIEDIENLYVTGDISHSLSLPVAAIKGRVGKNLAVGKFVRSQQNGLSIKPIYRETLSDGSSISTISFWNPQLALAMGSGIKFVDIRCTYADGVYDASITDSTYTQTGFPLILGMHVQFTTVQDTLYFKSSGPAIWIVDIELRFYSRTEW